MGDYILPWQSSVMLKHPWVLSAFFLIIAILLSFLTWFRRTRHEQEEDSSGNQDRNME